MRISDWSSDVCSSDLFNAELYGLLGQRRLAREGGRLSGLPDRLPSIHLTALFPHATKQDRKSVVSGKSVSVRVDLGGRRIIKKKKVTKVKDKTSEYSHDKSLND